MLGGFVFFSHQIGSFMGVWLGGYLYDRTGSYDIVWYISIALGVFAGLVNLPVRETPIAARRAARGLRWPKKPACGRSRSSRCWRVFALYTRPELVVHTGRQIWACFRILTPWGPQPQKNHHENHDHHRRLRRHRRRNGAPAGRPHGAGAALVLAARNEERWHEVAANAPRSARRRWRQDRRVQESECRAPGRHRRRPLRHIDALVNNAGMSAQALFEDVKAPRPALVRGPDAHQPVGQRLVHPRRPAAPEAARAASWPSPALAGLVGVPGRTAYSATKFAMTGFFEALRTELKSAGVSVTTAYPGVVATQIRHRGFNAAGVAAGIQRPEGRRGHERGGMRAPHPAKAWTRRRPRGGDDGQGQAGPLPEARWRPAR
jgi:NAD(P)-dependent dehydrogenase (short-subunit alcohol dehydrogenase family)